MDGIALLTALYQIKNFKPCNKHIRVLAKKIGLLTKNISTEILWSRLKEIQKNWELAELEKLVSKKGDWFTETLQWAV